MGDPVVFDSTREEVGLDKILELCFPQITKFISWEQLQNGNILDYGCGTGLTALRYILPNVESSQAKLYSVDVSDNMVDYARAHCSHERIHYSVGNILGKFPFENMTFDGIFSIQVFHFIRDLPGALTGLHGLLKPQGQLCFITTTTIVATETLKIVSESERWSPYMARYVTDYYPAWSRCKDDEVEQVFKSIFEKAGFVLSHFREIPIALRMTMEICLDFIEAINPFKSNIPGDMIPEFRNEMRVVLTTLLGIPLDEKEVNIAYNGVCGVAQKQ